MEDKYPGNLNLIMICAFRRLSWRIIPVALAVTAGTFICATALAQLVLHLEGLI